MATYAGVVLKALAVVVAVGLTVYCLFDVRSSASHLVRQLPRAMWFVVVLVPVAGPLAWLMVGRPLRRRPGPTPKPGRVVGPDDDPDFLREIERRRRRRPPGGDDPHPRAG